jgi:FtsP/CotA-like multicopper oxidase with cupredoxin domain
MKKINNIVWLLIPIVLVGFLIYKIAMNSFTSHFLGDKPQRTKAVIINEKNFMGNHPVDPLFTYSYKFTVDGKTYTGNSHDTALKVGDSVEIEYNKEHPRINKPLHPKE